VIVEQDGFRNARDGSGKQEHADIEEKTVSEDEFARNEIRHNVRMRSGAGRAYHGLRCLKRV
jgi:hypothetical protein